MNNVNFERVSGLPIPTIDNIRLLMEHEGFKACRSAKLRSIAGYAYKGEFVVSLSVIIQLVWERAVAHSFVKGGLKKTIEIVIRQDRANFELPEWEGAL